MPKTVLITKAPNWSSRLRVSVSDIYVVQEFSKQQFPVQISSNLLSLKGGEIGVKITLVSSSSFILVSSSSCCRAVFVFDRAAFPVSRSWRWRWSSRFSSPSLAFRALASCSWRDWSSSWVLARRSWSSSSLARDSAIICTSRPKQRTSWFKGVDHGRLRGPEPRKISRRVSFLIPKMSHSFIQNCCWIIHLFIHSYICKQMSKTLK